MRLAINFCKFDPDDLIPGPRAAAHVLMVAAVTPDLLAVDVGIHDHQYADGAGHLNTVTAGVRGVPDAGQSSYSMSFLTYMSTIHRPVYIRNSC